MSSEQAAGLLALAGSLPIASVDAAVLWQGALARAIARDHPAYDAFFVELAVRLKTHVVSYDARLQRSFPDEVLPPRRLDRR